MRPELFGRLQVAWLRGVVTALCTACPQHGSCTRQARENGGKQQMRRPHLHNVVIQQRLHIVCASNDVSASVLVAHHPEIHALPVGLHLGQRLLQAQLLGGLGCRRCGVMLFQDAAVSRLRGTAVPVVAVTPQLSPTVLLSPAFRQAVTCAPMACSFSRLSSRSNWSRYLMLKGAYPVPPLLACTSAPMSANTCSQ